MAGPLRRRDGRARSSTISSRVAADEAMHFALLDRKLRTLGAHYGALPAHDGLWEAAHETRHDVAARLAVVPMVLEARGLDVTPGDARARARAGRCARRAASSNESLTTKSATSRSAPSISSRMCEQGAESPGESLENAGAAAFQGRVEAAIQRLSASRSRSVAGILRRGCVVNFLPRTPQSTRRRGVPTISQ